MTAGAALPLWTGTCFYPLSFRKVLTKQRPKHCPPKIIK